MRELRMRELGMRELQMKNRVTHHQNILTAAAVHEAIL